MLHTLISRCRQKKWFWPPDRGIRKGQEVFKKWIELLRQTTPRASPLTSRIGGTWKLMLLPGAPKSKVSRKQKFPASSWGSVQILPGPKTPAMEMGKAWIEVMSTVWEFMPRNWHNSSIGGGDFQEKFDRYCSQNLQLASYVWQDSDPGNWKGTYISGLKLFSLISMKLVC